MTRLARHPARWRPPFFTVWTGQQVSLIGSSAVQFAIVWWLADLTDSATVLAAAMLMTLVPQALVGLLAGAYVDRWNRRVVLIAADSFIALVSLWLAYMFWIDAVQVWHIYIVVLARSLGTAFHLPAMSASTSLMVPERHLARVAGLNQTITGLINIIGPPVGALLLAFLPLHSVALVDVATALPAILSLAIVRIPQPPPAAGDGKATGRSRASILADVAEGLNYIRHWPGAVMLLGMALIIYFVISPTAAFPPLLVAEHFGGGAIELSWFELSWGLGVFIGGLFLSVWGGFRRRIYTSMMGLGLLGGGFVLVGVAPATAFWLAIVGNFVAGFANSLAIGPMYAVLQANVDLEMQGRVFTAISVSAAVGSLSLIIGGPVADAVGVQPWYLVGGLVCFAMGVGSFCVPTIAGIEQGSRGRRYRAPEPPGGGDA